MDGVRKLPRWGRPLALAIFLVALAGCGGGGATSAGGSSGGGTVGSPSSSALQRSGTPASATYTISWEAASDPLVTGHRIYFNYLPIGSGVTPSWVDVTGTSATLSPGNYGIFVGDTLYVAVASKGSGGLESPVSSQVSIVAQ